MKITGVLMFLAVASLLTAKAAQASIHLSKEYPFSPQQVADLENAQSTALHRSDIQHTRYAKTIDLANHISFSCVEGAPTASDGYGCSVNFGFKFAGGLDATVVKMYAPSVTAKQIQDQLAAVSPISTSASLDVGYITDTGGHIQCRPEFSNGTKAWVCYLQMADSAN